MHEQPPVSYQTIARLSRMDAEPNIFVTVAHETEMLGSFPTFPQTLNGWKEAGLKEKRKEKARERVKA
jgi:hypothetical protein